MATLSRYFFCVIFYCISFVYAPNCITIGHLPLALDSLQLGYGTEPHIVYLFGGLKANDKAVQDIYKWNVSSNTYIKLPITTPTITFHTFSNNAVRIDNFLYFVGMYDTQSMHIFNAATETWIDNTYISEMPQLATDGCLTDNGTHLFFIGGETAKRDWLDTLQIYDISANQWYEQQIQIEPIMSTGWNLGYCQIVRSELYVFGGELGTEIEYDFISDIIKWNLITEEWLHVGYLPIVTAMGIALRHHDYIYIVGGATKDEDVVVRHDIIYEFDTNIDQIIKEYTDALVASLSNLAARIIQNKLYVFGGWTGNDPIDEVQICDILHTPTETSEAPTFNTFSTNIVDTVEPTTLFTTRDAITQTTTTLMKQSTFEPSAYPVDQQTTKDPTAYPIHDTITQTKSTSMVQSTFESTAEASTNFASSQSMTESSITIQTTIAMDNKAGYELDVKQLLFIGIGSVVFGIFFAVIVICICMHYKRRRGKQSSNKNVVQLSAMYPEPGQFVMRHNAQNDDNMEGLQVTEEGVGDNDDQQMNIEYNMNAVGDQEVIGDDELNQTKFDMRHKQIQYNMNHVGDKEICGDEQTTNTVKTRTCTKKTTTCANNQVSNTE